ncbi:MAG: T9SS type A sorting domain-containing protein [Bacteroidetes bacterium]|nr:T9SS type A sorting domain-containing protein [Bacteroidota bacterium]
MKTFYFLFIALLIFNLTKGQIPGTPVIHGPDKLCDGSSSPVTYWADSINVSGIDSVVWYNSKTDKVYLSQVRSNFSADYYIDSSKPPIEDTILAQGINLVSGLKGDAGKIAVTFGSHATVGQNIISSDNVVCSNGIGKYKAIAYQNVEKFHWKFISGPDTLLDTLTVPDSITLNFSTLGSGGNLTVKGWNSTCLELGNPSNPFNIQLKPKLVPTIINLSDPLSTSDNVCRNQLVTYNANLGFYKYTWGYQNGTPIGDTTSRTITMKWNSQSGYGYLSVTVTKDSCEGTSYRNVTIENDSAPNPATIWLFGYELLVCSDSSPGLTYHWYYNSILQDSASNSQRYFMAKSSDPYDYWVETCYGGCCNTSYHFNFNSRISTSNKDILNYSVYPNPVSTKLFIKVEGTDTSQLSIYLLNIYGTIVNSASGCKSLFEIDVSDCPNGLYLLKIISGRNRSFHYKLIKY